MTILTIRVAINMKRFAYILDNIELLMVKTIKYAIFTLLVPYNFIVAKVFQLI